MNFQKMESAIIISGISEFRNSIHLVTTISLVICLFATNALAADKTSSEKIKEIAGAGEASSEKESESSSMRQGPPKWDVGLAFGYFNTPDYPGSDESHNRFLTLPYFYYRGELIRNDREGLRGRLFNSKRVEASLSAGAAFPAKSSENKARTGMPDIDWTGQIGPQLEIHLNQNPIAKVDLLIPYRFVFSTDFKRLDSRGSVFNPEIKLRHRALFDPKMFFSFSAGGVWASESLNDYFFDVPSNYAIANRPQYDAQPGFMGYESSFVITRMLTPHLIFYSGFQKRFYADAKNRASSLLRDIETELYFVGLAWSIFQSGQGYVDPSRGQ